MDLVLQPNGVKLKYYCDECEGDDENVYDVYRIIDIWNVSSEGAPYCHNCDSSMELDCILVSPTTPIENNHV